MKKKTTSFILFLLLVIIQFSSSAFAQETLTNDQMKWISNNVVTTIPWDGSVTPTPDFVYKDAAKNTIYSTAEFLYMMSYYLRYFKINNSPPNEVPVVRGIAGPTSPVGLSTGIIQKADFLAKAEEIADYIEANNRVPDMITIGSTDYNPIAMFSSFLRAVKWYRDNSTLPNSTGARTTTAPFYWIFAEQDAPEENCVTNLQLLKTCVSLNPSGADGWTVPNTVTVNGIDVTASEFFYMMTKFWDYCKNNSNIPQVPILRDINGPVSPGGGANSGIQIMKADYLNKGQECVEYIELHKIIQDSVTVEGIGYNIEAMFSVFARAIKWFGDRGLLTNYVTARLVYNPTVWPVELTTFTASLVNNNIILKWQTATEISNYGFDIERNQMSETGNQNSDWEKIGFVTGSGNSNSPKYYSFVDKNPVNGKNLYRLKQIDNDGQYEYSDVAEVSLEKFPGEYLLLQNYPNPFNPATTIRYALPYDSNVKLKIHNSLGEEITTLINEVKSAGYYKTLWNSQNISSGVYFYTLEVSSLQSVQAGENKFSIRKKMILIK